MSYEYESLRDVSPLVLDLETAPLPNVRDYVDPPDVSDIKAPSNYKDAAKIDDYILREREKRLAEFDQACTGRAALDFNVARIVALGAWCAGELHIEPCNNEDDERHALDWFWRTARHRTLIGFRIREFDLPMLMQRSRYLGVPCPVLDLGRYARASGICDLYDLLTFQDMRQEALMRRSLTSFARRFGLPCDDSINGADIPALVAAGDWEAITRHVTSDVLLTLALARRLGVVQPEPINAVL